MTRAVLTISSRNYSSWSLRGWLLCKMAGLDFDVEVVPPDDPETRAELLLLAPAVRVPRLTDGEVSVWDTLAIGEYLAERFPDAGLMPTNMAARAHCRAISGAIHAGFYNLRSALPMNLKAQHRNFRIFSGAKPDIEYVQEIWRSCIERHGGPWLFGTPSLADAMYAPVATRFLTYGVAVDPVSAAYCDTIMGWPFMQEWIAAAKEEPDAVEELDMEF